MPCDYGGAMSPASKRLRLLLRIWVVIFVLGALDFFVFPYLTIRILDSTARSLGMHEVAALAAGQDFWLTLAVPSLTLVRPFPGLPRPGRRSRAHPRRSRMRRTG